MIFIVAATYIRQQKCQETERFAFSTSSTALHLRTLSYRVVIRITLDHDVPIYQWTHPRIGLDPLFLFSLYKQLLTYLRMCSVPFIDRKRTTVESTNPSGNDILDHRSIVISNNRHVCHTWTYVPGYADVGRTQTAQMLKIQRMNIWRETHKTSFRSRFQLVVSVSETSFRYSCYLGTVWRWIFIKSRPAVMHRPILQWRKETKCARAYHTVRRKFADDKSASLLPTRRGTWSYFVASYPPKWTPKADDGYAPVTHRRSGRLWEFQVLLRRQNFYRRIVTDIH